jgi:hypothetical protein
MMRTKVFRNDNYEDSKPIKHDFINIGTDWMTYINNNNNTDKFEPVKYLNEDLVKFVLF